MAVVVTGASGFVGSHLVCQLHRAGYSVVGLDRRPPPAGQPGSHIVADLLDLDRPGPRCGLAVAEAARDALNEAEAVWHLAGCPGVRSTGPDVATRRWRDNVVATELVAAAVPRPGAAARHVVLLGLWRCGPRPSQLGVRPPGAARGLCRLQGRRRGALRHPGGARWARLCRPTLHRGGGGSTTGHGAGPLAATPAAVVPRCWCSARSHDAATSPTSARSPGRSSSCSSGAPPAR